MKPGPIIRATEQLILIVKQDLTLEGLYKYQRPRTWNGCMEIERKEYATYADILHLVDDKPEMIVRVLRFCIETGRTDDITDDVLDAAEDKPVSSCSVPELDFRGEPAAITSARRPDMSRKSRAEAVS